MANAYDLTPSAAKAYDAEKVPAIFGPLAEASLDLIDLEGIEAVLDVACGSGAVVRALDARLARPTRISGADLSAAMIEEARNHPASGRHKIDFAVAPAEAMPFTDASFDLVLCQQGLQFFPDKPGALAEMRRLTRPGGRLALTCWAGTPPLFATIADHLAAKVSDRAAGVAVKPFAFSDAAVIAGLIEAAGFAPEAPQKIDVYRRIAATEAAIATELLATPNEPELRQLPADTFDDLTGSILADLANYRDGDGLALPQSSWLFIAGAT